MAFEDDLRVFMENRLQAFDPTIDLGANSPAQVQIIEPTISRFGTDPFSVDIPTFMRDRLVQEFPELAADEAGLLEDLFTEPLQLLLEPFKREIELTRINQSVENASLLSDDEADALGSNFFETREEGDFAGGLVRLFFAAPTTSRITTDRQVTSRQGFAYFPTENTFITSAQMIFNRDGTQFFVDISVRAEEAGDTFNVIAGDITSIDDVEGVIRVSNPTAFTTGQPRETNEDYLDGIPQALTERSLVTKRGVTTRTPDLFGSEVRAIQVVGAGEEGMDRDILTGTGEGFVHMVGTCSFFGNMVFLGSLVYKDDGPDNNVVLQVGDSIRLILDVGSDPDRIVNEAIITDFISTGVGTAAEKHILFLDQALVTLIGSSGTGASIAILKAGFITISGIPGGIAANVTVPDGQVHLGGHTDVMVRPSADSQQEGVVPNLTSGEPLMALLDIVTTSGDNKASSAGSSFVTAEVKAGDLLVIESGTSAGSYKILSVGSPDTDFDIRVDSLFTIAETGLRARVVRTINVDLVEPKVPKVPFTASPVSDLRTTVGSALFRLLSTDLQTLGAAIGDTIRVLSGTSAGDYIIRSFDSVLGGQGPVVDRAAASSEAGLLYEVFTVSDGLSFPLVRVRSLEVLDSTNQGTGIAVPYGDAVDVRALCDLEGAGNSFRVLSNQLIMFPDASLLWGSDGGTLPEVFASTTFAGDDASYSKGLKPKDGRIRTASSGGGNPISTTELNFPPFLYNGRRDAFIALTTEEDPNFTDTNTIPSAPGEHRTSPLAEASIGDSLVILDGPNAGSFTIKDVRVLDMWSKSTDGHRKVALIQVDQEMRIDPIRSFIDYITDVGSESVVTAVELADYIEEATRFFSASGFFEDILIPRVLGSMTSQGFTVTTEEVRELVIGLASTGYETGQSANGTLRMFFQEPVSAELFFGEDDPTTFQAVQNTALNYRLDPKLPPAQILPEADEETPPTEWARDLAIRDESPRLNAFHVNGSSFALQGILTGDIIEYHRAINDLPSRKDMLSSWLCVTQAGSNIVRMIVPKANNGEGLENDILPEPGHLFFIDSGPDIGAYVVTEVFDTNDLTSSPPSIQFKLDKALTHSTEVFPPVTDMDHTSQAKSVLVTIGNDFTSPMALIGATLSVDLGGLVLTHTFVSNPADIDALVAEIAGGPIVSGGKVEVTKDVDELVLRSTLSTYPDEELFIRSASTGIGVGLIQYTALQADGRHLSALASSGTKRLIADVFSSGWSIDQWVSVFAANDGTPGAAILSDGEDESYLGTFKVVAVGTISGGPRDSEPFIELDREVDFAADANVRWVRHAAPTQTPATTTDGGKELASTFVRGRMYREVPEQRTISIPWGTASVNPIDDLSEEEIKVGTVSADDFITGSGSSGFSHKMPYRIIREGVKRISSTAMASQRSGALYFMDVPVIGIGVLEELNITPAIGLTLEGRFNIAGYTLRVDDENFSYSVDEGVSLILPGSVLPVGSTPGLDNEISLAGQNLQINYDNAPLVASIQQFYDSPLDRVVVANTLVRHFLPSYVFLDINYVGGDGESVVAAELIDHINSVDPDLNELVVDSLVEIVKQRNADQVRLPINIIVLTHGVDRRIRGSQSEDVVGGQNIPTFRGTFNQTFFIPGPDTSAETVRPDGEQVFLVRL